ncbi:MAG TPA: hypothetical protein VNU21_01825 [Usitatibacter sp.]|jgi:hypothetical protein|nr:hypothetical protein [Usitatibacter sp.]
MTELEQLRQRRELVILAAELQRATVVRRLERIQANPAKRVLGIAANAVSRPLMIKLGSAAVTFAVRAYRKKRSTRKKKLKH